MTQRPLLSAFCALALLAHTNAQDDEADFNQRQAKSLNAFAEKAFKKGFPRIAKVVWLQTIKLYDADNAEAWISLGYVKIGASWNPDPKHPYPTTDTGSGSEGQPLQKNYEALKKDLASQHKRQAEKWAKAGRTDRALHHWRSVLRWVDDDQEAKKALAYVEVGTLSGTDLEKTLYERSKMIEKAVEEQSKIDYEIKKVDGIACAPLDEAQVKYVTVQSEHFTLHGDAEEETNLFEALRWAERTLQVCKVAFPWSYQDSKWPLEWACLVTKETYHQILKANKVPDLEWKLEHGASTVIGNTELTNTAGVQVLYDSCVRNVAQGYSGFRSTGYNEGIGHTFVGMMFNNNRLFSIDRKRQEGTSASEEDREFQSPDFDVWKNLNLEMAWKSTGGVPANMLPFCDASAFTNEERIKAWSFCDYMMRRDPEMLRAMDAIAQELKSQRNKQPAEFEKRFEEKQPVTIPQLDKEWEDFWTGASPVLKAIQNNTPPLNAISKGVDKWLEAFNEARKKFKRAPVTWSANFSARCKEHADYLKNNKDQRGAAAEHTEKVDLGGSYIGSLFAQMAVVQTGANIAKAKKLFEEWIYLPGYRDVLINHTILSVGMYLEGDILVINATSGIGKSPDPQAGFDCYPPRDDSGSIFDREVKVEDLGPEVEQLLAKHERAGQKTIGFPLTMHFGSTGGIDLRSSLACNVATDKGEKIEGVLVFDSGEIRRSTAPGMATFWPLSPLPKGKIQFTWSWTKDGKQGVIRGGFGAK
ncbi:MAG: CAP domain-containing protein [Planctomycetota bacterium]